MKASYHWQFKLSVIGILGMAVLSFFFKIAMGMKTWLAIVWVVAGVAVLLPALTRKEELKTTSDWNQYEKSLFLSILAAQILLVISECLFLFNEYIPKEKIGLLGNILYHLPLLLPAAIGFYHLTTAILAKSQGKKYLLLALCGMLSILCSLSGFIYLVTGHTPGQEWIRICFGMLPQSLDLSDSSLVLCGCFVICFPGAVRLSEMERYGHI